MTPEEFVDKAIDRCYVPLPGDPQQPYRIAAMSFDLVRLEMIQLASVAQDAARNERERIAKIFETEAALIPPGDECRHRGASIYNWMKWAASKIRAS